MTKLVVKSSFIDRATGEYIVQGNGFAPKSSEQRDRLQKRGVLSKGPAKEEETPADPKSAAGVPSKAPTSSKAAAK